MFANLYEITCALARRRGAIGVFYPVRVYEPANTAEQAERAFRDSYETQGPPVAVAHKAIPCSNCGQWQALDGDCSNECKRRGFAE